MKMLQRLLLTGTILSAFVGVQVDASVLDDHTTNREPAFAERSHMVLLAQADEPEPKAKPKPKSKQQPKKPAVVAPTKPPGAVPATPPAVGPLQPQRPSVPPPAGSKPPERAVPPGAATQAPAQPNSPPPAPPAVPGQPISPPSSAQSTPHSSSPAAQGQPPIAQRRPIAPTAVGVGIAPQSSQGQPLQRIDQLRGERHESVEGGRTIIQEPDRTIIREGNRTIIRHSELDRFRYGARDVRVEQRGNNSITVAILQNGDSIVTTLDENGFLLRRSRILPDGREIIIIDNHPRGPGFAGFFVNLPPPVIRIPHDRYIVDIEGASPELLYETLIAPPVDVIERPYTLDEIRFSAPLRDRMPRIDLNTLTFDTGSWEVTPDQIGRLAVIAGDLNRIIERYPKEVFLIEGFTDAVGSDVDNLSLSDRRAETVAIVLTQQFGVPPENLSTQGYGAQFLKIPTQEPERANRRVTVQRITPLLAGHAH
jgi:outer membrane protein OmpA-like peptidoglycan-associated protein